MAKAARIDQVILHPDRRLEIHYTEGDAPLPVLWQGQGLIYQVPADLADEVRATEDQLGGGLLKFLILGLAITIDPDGRDRFKQACEGRTITVDLQTPTRPRGVIRWEP